MIDRQKINKVLDCVYKYSETENLSISISPSGDISVSIYPKGWWNEGTHWSDEKRHEVLASVTPLVGKMEKHISDRNIGYSGSKDGISIRLDYINQCKILGYKTIKKTVQKEIERKPEYETEEVEERVAITDCDLRQGKFKESDIEDKV